MILVTCTIASFVAQKGARNISLTGSISDTKKNGDQQENILIPLKDSEDTDELINLSLLIKRKDNRNGVYALNVINNQDSDPDADKKSQKILDKAQKTAASADIQLCTLSRYDVNVPNAIMSVIRENKVTDLVLGLHEKEEFSESFLGNTTERILANSNVSTYIYRAVQPIATVKRHIIVIPENAEAELGFPLWVIKIWNLALNTGSKLVFYGTRRTLGILQDVYKDHPIQAEFRTFDDWNDFLIVTRDMQLDDNLVVVMSRTGQASFHNGMKKMPNYMTKYFSAYNVTLIYPVQAMTDENENTDLMNASLLPNINKLEGVGKAISKTLKNK